MLRNSARSDSMPILAPLPAPPSPGPVSAAAIALPPLRLWAVTTLVLALAFLAWEAAGGDRWLADMAGNASGFPLRNHWLLDRVTHSGGRLLAWALALALCLGVWWPQGPLRLLSLPRRLQLAGGVLLSVAVVALLKSANPTACPWSLTTYGGAAEPISHWLWWVTPEGGRGGCFPAGHASAGFGFIGGYFVFRPVAPVLARRWLVVAVAAGLLLGISQQWRGAHFMSHTLWSGWLCWCLAWALDTACSRADAAPAKPVAAP
jgi:membrane-associated PAP2 superfamily phosphatase